MSIGNKIDVITYTDPNGNMRPVRIRMENNDGIIILQVKNAIIKNIRTFGQNKIIKYTCQSIANGILISYKVTYDIGTMQWLLYAKDSSI